MCLMRVLIILLFFSTGSGIYAYPQESDPELVKLVRKSKYINPFLIKLMDEKDFDFFSKIMNIGIKNNKIFYDKEIVIKILFFLIDSLKDQTVQNVSIKATNLIFHYINFGSKGSSKLLNVRINDILEAVNNEVTKIDLTIKEKGILLGAIFSGSYKYANKIKSSDERRIFKINSITNLVWASTTLLGAIPIVGQITAAVAGSISLGVVTWDVVANGIGTRDLSPSIRTIEGYLQLELLENIKDKNAEKKLEAIELILWIKSVIHFNGLSN